MTAVRERLRAIETQLDAFGAQAGQNTLNASQSGASLASIQAQLVALQNTVNTLTAGNDDITLRADADIPVYSLVYPSSDGGCAAMDPSGPIGIFGPIGVTTIVASLGQSVNIRRAGRLSTPGAGFTPMQAVFAAIGGGLTQHPTYGSVAIPIGVAISDALVYISPDWPTVLAISVYSDQQAYLAASFGIVRDAVEFMQAFNALPDGILVKIGENAVGTRALIAGSGSGLTISNPDGVDGDPAFEVHP